MTKTWTIRILTEYLGNVIDQKMNNKLNNNLTLVGMKQ